jgi:hypothetical protein
VSCINRRKPVPRQADRSSATRRYAWRRAPPLPGRRPTPAHASLAPCSAPSRPAARRLRRWPTASLDRACARRHNKSRPGRRNRALAEQRNQLQVPDSINVTHTTKPSLTVMLDNMPHMRVGKGALPLRAVPTRSLSVWHCSAWASQELSPPYGTTKRGGHKGRPYAPAERAIPLLHQLHDLAVLVFALRPVLADVLEQRRIGHGVEHRVA